MESVISPFFLSGYALDPSLDNHQVSTKYIGSVEEAEKNQGNLFKFIWNISYQVCVYIYTHTLIISVLQNDLRL